MGSYIPIAPATIQTNLSSLNSQQVIKNKQLWNKMDAIKARRQDRDDLVHVKQYIVQWMMINTSYIFKLLSTVKARYNFFDVYDA